MTRLAWLALALCFLAACANTSGEPLPMVTGRSDLGAGAGPPRFRGAAAVNAISKIIAVDGEAAERCGEERKIPRRHGSGGGARHSRPVGDRHRLGDRRRRGGLLRGIDLRLGDLAAAEDERGQILPGRQIDRHHRRAGRPPGCAKDLWRRGRAAISQTLHRGARRVGPRDGRAQRPSHQADVHAGRAGALRGQPRIRRSSPVKALGKDGHVSVENFRFHPLAIGKDGETRRYLVQFDRTVWQAETKDPTQPWSATVDFQWHPGTADAADRPHATIPADSRCSDTAPVPTPRTKTREESMRMAAAILLASVSLAAIGHRPRLRIPRRPRRRSGSVPYSPLQRTEIIGVIGQPTTITFPRGRKRLSRGANRQARQGWHTGGCGLGRSVAIGDQGYAARQ